MNCVILEYNTYNDNDSNEPVNLVECSVSYKLFELSSCGFVQLKLLV